MSEERWAAQLAKGCINLEVGFRASEWMAKHMRLLSATKQYDPTLTPWTIDPIDTLTDDSVQVAVLMKPVQTGGSLVGEGAACVWGATWTQGMIQINFEKQEKANQRWDERIEPILRGCAPLVSRLPADPHKAKRCHWLLPMLAIKCQGIKGDGNLDSDTVRGQINEEVHNWAPGMLEKAFNRTISPTNWNRKIIVISNAGEKDDQLHAAYKDGTQEVWSFRCPCCGYVQPWQSRRRKSGDGQWLPGGLYYDAEGCRRGKWDYDYLRLESTVRYECANPECRAHFVDTDADRRRLNEASLYVAENPYAKRMHRSWTYDGVCAYGWLDMIQKKHSALKAMAYGDPEPYRRYVVERECRPWDVVNDNPLVETISLSAGVTMRKAEDAEHRTFMVDRQEGKNGDIPHYRGSIRSIRRDEKTGKYIVALEWQGRLNTDEEVEAKRLEYGVPAGHEKNTPKLVWVDSGYDSDHVYQLCAKYGYVAIKGDRADFFWHRGKSGVSRKCWTYGDPKRPAHVPVRVRGSGGEVTVNVPFIRYSKQGIRNKLHFLRNSPEWDWQIPADVDADFKRDYTAEEIRHVRQPDGSERPRWVQRDGVPNDYFVCDCYHAMVCDVIGIVTEIRSGA